MADEEPSKVDLPPPPSFLEVTCKSSGRKTRYAVGTKAGFAVNLINRKLDVGRPLALHIEAVKEGEESINFGPDAVLVDYGNGWKLQTVTEVDYSGLGKGERVPLAPGRIPGVESSDGTHRRKTVSKPGISFVYMGKILLAFVLIFVLGAIFTLALENLPRLILFLNSSM
ncbi:Maltase-glucoamylase, intestinal [Melia azedarach]|uniref:Maltase-glucoamylase, intestinal n=1 Tax=Melia azedarach TaxID=155640 RepID=A0ACC1YDE7_MELAZ|nr:Maltase-glucoamylase, intestinal [Melia azedarach]